eukprot:1195045-Prorocentrum_minimum.AAC.2
MQSSYCELLLLISVRAYRNVSCRRDPRARASPHVQAVATAWGHTAFSDGLVRRFGRRPRPITSGTSCEQREQAATDRDPPTKGRAGSGYKKNYKVTEAYLT